MLDYAVLILAALILAAPIVCAAKSSALGGGADQRRPAAARASKNLVVDTLNLMHWLRAQRLEVRSQRLEVDVPRPDAPRVDAALRPDASVIAAIAYAAPRLQKRYSGTITFVLKDRDSRAHAMGSATRGAFQAAAERYRVHIACAERYPDNPTGAKQQTKHSAAGRDDFYMCWLARQHRCCVATEDRLRDFAEFRTTVAPFIAYTFTHWRALPTRDFLRPDACARLRPPCAVRFADALI